MALEKIMRNSIGGAILALAGCATSFQPKDDYNNYPGYKKEIALYNLRGILQESCKKSTVDENGFSCEWKRCVGWGRIAPAPGSIYESTVCVTWEPQSISYQWQQLQSLRLLQAGNCLKFGDKNGCDLETKNEEKAAAFIKAVYEYR